MRVAQAFFLQLALAATALRSAPLVRSLVDFLPPCASTLRRLTRWMPANSSQVDGLFARAGTFAELGAAGVGVNGG